MELMGLAFRAGPAKWCLLFSPPPTHTHMHTSTHPSFLLSLFYLLLSSLPIRSDLNPPNQLIGPEPGSILLSLQKTATPPASPVLYISPVCLVETPSPLPQVRSSGQGRIPFTKSTCASGREGLWEEAAPNKPHHVTNTPSLSFPACITGSCTYMVS